MISKKNIQNIAFFAAVCIFLFLPGVLFAEVAVLPYKVKNPSRYFPVSKGGEYSRMLAVAALVTKEDLSVTSPRDVALDMKKLDIDHQGTVTGDSLDLLGRTRRIDYFLLGSLSYLNNRYYTESVLYSVRDRKVVLRVEASARSLFDLAGEESRQAFARYRTAEKSRTAALDAAFLFDMSYSMNRDWKSVKSALTTFASGAIDAGRVDTRIYGIPFSAKYSVEGAFTVDNSVVALKKGLNKLKPYGGASPENFNRALKYAVQNIRWRERAEKLVVIITNSDLNRARFAEKYAYIAKNRNIQVCSITLGNLNKEETEVVDRLAAVTGGLRRSVAYHQRLFDAGATPLDIYLERGRLFTSRVYHRDWRDGLYDSSGHQTYYGRPRGFLTEVFYDDNKKKAGPGNMADLFMKQSMKRIINQKPPDNNMESIMGTIQKTYGASGPGQQGPAGRALLSQGSVSLWVRVRESAMMEYLRQKGDSGFMVTLGCAVQTDPSSTYGVTLIPKTHRVTYDYIPKTMMVSLRDIISKRDYYATRGLLRPPIWFVKVKVEQVKGGPGMRDVRD